MEIYYYSKNNLGFPDLVFVFFIDKEVDPPKALSLASEIEIAAHK